MQCNDAGQRVILSFPQLTTVSYAAWKKKIKMTLQVWILSRFLAQNPELVWQPSYYSCLQRISYILLNIFWIPVLGITPQKFSQIIYIYLNDMQICLTLCVCHSHVLWSEWKFASDSTSDCLPGLASCWWALNLINCRIFTALSPTLSRPVLILLHTSRIHTQDNQQTKRDLSFWGYKGHF